MIFVRMNSIRDNFSWVITNIYVPNSKVNRARFWKKIEEGRNDFKEDTWILMGDFNTPLNDNENLGGILSPNDSRADLYNFISNQGLIDLDLQGVNYTWSNQWTGIHKIESNLDRALITHQWLISCNCTISSFPKVGSKHFPLLLEINPLNVPRHFPFRFEKMWIKHLDLERRISDWWNINIEGTAMFKVPKKIINIEDKIKHWNKDVFGDIFQQLNKMKSHLAAIQEDIQSQGLTKSMKLDEQQAPISFHDLIDKEEIYWRQRSCVDWLKEGDKNTKFFHLTNLKHRATNQIAKISKNNQEIHKEEEIKNATISHFSSLLSANNNLDICNQNSLLEAIPSLVSLDQNKFLEAIPSNKEIKETFFSFDGDKALGPDGFPMFFFQIFQQIIESDLTNDIKEFFGCISLLKEINDTFLALIPKIVGANSFDQFKHISLWNSFYKILSKVLTSRILKILPLLISP